MTAIVIVPTVLKRYFDNKQKLEISGQTIKEVLENLIKLNSTIQQYIFNSENELCSFMNVFLNGKDIRFSQGLQTQVQKDDVISLIPAIAGG
jgi:sulfur-carrier protein